MKKLLLLVVFVVCVVVLYKTLDRSGKEKPKSESAQTTEIKTEPEPFTEQKKAEVEKLLVLLEEEKSFNYAFEAYKQTLKTMQRQAFGNVMLGQQEMLNKRLNMAVAELKKVVNWQSMKEIYIREYANAYTEKEVRAMVEFFSSPAGKAYVKNRESVQMAVVRDIQAKLTELQPKIREWLGVPSSPIPPSQGVNPAVTPPLPPVPSPTPANAS